MNNCGDEDNINSSYNQQKPQDNYFPNHLAIDAKPSMAESAATVADGQKSPPASPRLANGQKSPTRVADGQKSPPASPRLANGEKSPPSVAHHHGKPPGSPNCASIAKDSTRRSLFGHSKRRRVDKFYQKQCNLVESYEQDSKQIQNFQQKRALQSQSSVEARQQNGDHAPLPLDDASAVTVELRDSGECDAYASDADARLLERVSVKSVANGTCGSPMASPLPHIRIIRSDSSRHSSAGAPKGTCTLARAARRLALFTLGVNLGLTMAKAVASYLSGSLSIISSLVDSLVDITSGLVIWLTGRAIRKHDPYLYPVGRTRLEPVALVIVSVIMAVASVQMIVQSMESIYHQRIHPRVDWPTIVIMCATVVVKMCLYCMCSRLKADPSSRVLAQDHRNDCLSNSIALLCAFGAHKFWLYLDPIGAILVALYIAITWYRTGKEHLIMLSGRSAKPEFINRIIKVCIDHDPRIQYIDTVYVYHFGTRFLVEVHIVLDEDMRLKEAHDISESLQNSIEALPDVERAFLHVDYEFEHKPQDEHKVP